MKTFVAIILPLLLALLVFTGCSKSELQAEVEQVSLEPAAPKKVETSDTVARKQPFIEAESFAHNVPPAEDILLPEPAVQTNTISTPSQEAPITTDRTTPDHDIVEAEALEIAREAVREVSGIGSNVMITSDLRNGYYVFEFSRTNSVDFIRKVVVNAERGDIKYIWLPAQ